MLTEAAIRALLMALVAIDDGGSDGIFAAMVSNDKNAMVATVMALSLAAVAVIDGGNGNIFWQR